VTRVRTRLTLVHAALLVGATAVLLGMSWWLLAGHLDRTLPDAYADAVMGRVAAQYTLAVVGMTLLALGVGWVVAGRALAPLEAAAEQRRRFVSNASHELRTPLTVIRTEAEVTLSDPRATPEELRAMGRVVLDTTERMERLLDGLLVLAAGELALRRREPVDLGAVAQRALATVSAEAAAAGVRVELQVSSAATLGDEALLERLVDNLLENAVRHNRPGGMARITVGAGDKEVLVRVTNDGASLGREELERLAQPFQRLDRSTSAPGSGLGLSIVRAVAEAHGGELVLRARPEGGLDATVRLPAARAALTAS
jgi:signal transduction histidine kinase